MSKKLTSNNFARMLKDIANSVKNLPRNSVNWGRNMANELVHGMGTKKMIELVVSPLGLVGVFFVFISAVLPLLPGAESLLASFRFMFFFIALAGSWNIIGGYAGEIDFGHVVFFGLGSYTAAISYVNYGINIWVSFFLGGVVAMLFALLIGVPILRLRGAYFAVAMLAVAKVVEQLVSYFADFTGGGAGISTGILLQEFEDIRVTAYYLMLFASVMSFFISHYVSYSRLGLSLRAIKASHEGAAAAGIDVLKSKVQAFMISGFIAGIVGAFNITVLFVVEPAQTFPTSLTVQMIIMTFVGGIAMVFGPVLGAILLSPLNIYLTKLLANVEINIFGLTLDFGSGYIIIYGVFFIGIILYLPKGIMGYLVGKGYVKEEALVEKPILDEDANVEQDEKTREATEVKT